MWEAGCSLWRLNPRGRGRTALTRQGHRQLRAGHAGLNVRHLQRRQTRCVLSLALLSLQLQP